MLYFETDFGALLIISLTAFAMLFAAGSYLKQLGIVTTSLFAVVGILIALNPNRLDRLTSFYKDWTQVHQTYEAVIGIARGRMVWHWLGWWNSKIRSVA